MATHGTQRQVERDRDYAREEMARLRARCEVMEQQLLETERRLLALENFMGQMSDPR